MARTFFYVGDSWNTLDFSGSTFDPAKFEIVDGVVMLKPGAITNADIASNANISQGKINGLTTSLDEKVDKINTANRLYGTDASGEQTSYIHNTSPSANVVPMRDASGNIHVNYGVSGNIAIGEAQVGEMINEAITEGIVEADPIFTAWKTDTRLAAGLNASAGTGSTALGPVALATANYSTALGRNTKATAVDATAIGNGASSSSTGSVAIGSESVAGVTDLSPNDTIGVISVGNATNKRRIINVKDGVNDYDAVNMKQLREGGGSGEPETDPVFTAWKTGTSIGAGLAANASGSESISIGENSVSSGLRSVAIGRSASVSLNAARGIAIGDGSQVIDSDVSANADELSPLSVGYGSGSSERKRKIRHVATGIAPSDAATVGQTIPDAPKDGKEYGRKDGAWVEVQGTGGAETDPIFTTWKAGASISAGYNAQTPSANAVGIGNSNMPKSADAVALGHNAAVDEQSMGSVALGAGSTVLRTDILGTDTSNMGVVSVGHVVSGTESKRRIIHVADGVHDSDAATVKQVKNATITETDPIFTAWKNGNRPSIGTHSEMAGNNSISIGPYSMAPETDAVAIGGGENLSQMYGVAIGSGAQVGDRYGSAPAPTSDPRTHGIAIGDFASVPYYGGIALGPHSHAESGGIAIGAASYSTDVDKLPNEVESPVSFGTTTDFYPTSIKRRLINVADGVNDSDVTTVGQLNTKLSDAPSDGLQYARQNGAWTHVSGGISIETDPVFTTWKNASKIVAGSGSAGNGLMSIAIGSNSDSRGQYSVAIGRESVVLNGLGTSIGYQSNVQNSAQINGSIALGSGSKVAVSDARDGDASGYGVLSIGETGKSGTYRRIINVRNAVDDSDATTLGQIKTLIAESSEGDVTASKLGNPIAITDFNTFSPSSLNLLKGEIIPFTSYNATNKPNWVSGGAYGYIQKAISDNDNDYTYIAYPSVIGSNSGFAVGNYLQGSFRGWQYLTKGDINGNALLALNSNQLGGINANQYVTKNRDVETNLNNITNGGMYQIGTNAGQPPGSTSHSNLLVLRNIGDSIYQLYGDRNGNLFVRGESGTTVTSGTLTASWRQIIDSSNTQWIGMTTLYNFMSGSKTITSLSNLVLDKQIQYVNISANQTLSVSSRAVDGQPAHLYIQNTSANPITITLPNADGYVSFSGTEIEILGNGYAEISIAYDTNINKYRIIALTAE